MRKCRYPYKRIPDHYAGCTALVEDKGPLITSLTDGAEYLVFAGRKQNLMLKSSCANGTHTVYWYVDKKFLKQAAPNETVYFEAVKGNHTVTCSDDRGRWSSISSQGVVYYRIFGGSLIEWDLWNLWDLWDKFDKWDFRLFCVSLHSHKISTYFISKWL
jgi:hypothetical protein